MPDSTRFPDGNNPRPQRRRRPLPPGITEADIAPLDRPAWRAREHGLYMTRERRIREAVKIREHIAKMRARWARAQARAEGAR